jgi:transposase InsO family protein
MVGPAAKRDGVAHLRAVIGLSERRACQIVGADRKMVRYRPCRPPDTALRARLRELANERRRFGYRRLFILLRREGEPSGVNRIHRLYREEGLSVRKRRARRKAVGARAPILVEAKPRRRGQNPLTQESRIDSRLQIRGGSFEPRRSDGGRVAYPEGVVAG